MGKIAINIATGSLQKEEMIVGIDLGTTNSLVAIMHPETRKPIALKDVDDLSIVPSIVYFDMQDKPIVGNSIKEKLIAEPEKTIFSVKRLMGKSYKDVQENTHQIGYNIIEDNEERLVKIKVGNKFYSPLDLSALILEELKHRAEHALKTSVTKAVITVPAYFNDAQRQATRDAGKMAGLDVLRIINEPTAASLAYGIGINPTDEQTVAVYDLGGGTFDISILKIHNGIFEVLSTHGDTALGGDDMDFAVVNFWAEKYFKNQNLDKEKLSRLKIFAEEAKKHLSKNDLFEKEFDGVQLSLSKNEFNVCIENVINKTLESCKQAMKDANLKVEEIDQVLMVGGSTRVPLVKNKIEEFFKKPLNDSLNPDEVVALGAAIQADILAGNNKEMLLLDITPLSLGIETSGQLMDVLIPRNTKIPAKASRQYTTQVDGQSGIKIAVYQGERDIVTNNRKLAEFNLTGIPSMPAGLPKVEISFLIDADSILKVSAKELRSGVEQEVEIKPQLGLSDSDVEKMLSDSIEHAQEDIAARALAEAKSEGEQLLLATENFLKKNSGELTREELMETANAMQALQLSLTMDDKNLVQEKSEALNNISRPYAERIMDNAIGNAMKGKTI